MLSSRHGVLCLLLSLMLGLPAQASDAQPPAGMRVDNLLYLEGLRLGLDHSAEVIAATGNSLRAMAHHGFVDPTSSRIDRSNPVFRQHVAAAARRYWVHRAPKREPTKAELMALYQATQADYLVPEQRSFSHHYFRDSQDWDAVTALANTGESVPSVAHPLGARFSAITQAEIKKRFGAEFAMALFNLPNDDQWHGPVLSTLGFHVIKIEGRQAAGQPDFELIKPTLIARWQRQQQERWLESKFVEIRQRIQAQ